MIEKIPRVDTLLAKIRKPAVHQLSVGFILANRFTLTAFASFVDVLRLAADTGDQSRQIRCGWKVLSADMRPIRASCGLVIQPDVRLGDPDEFDYIVVAGGLVDHIENTSPQHIDYLRRAAERNIPVVGLCTGSFILHEAGLMDGYKCCVSWFHRADFIERFEGLEPISDRIFVVDRNRLTCSGGTSAAHLAAYIVERHIGRRHARKSLNILIVDEFHDDRKAQPNLPVALKTDDNILQRALVIMQQDIESKLPVGELAQRLRIGRRSLETRFRKGLNMSPAQTMSFIRIQKAKELLSGSELTISEIAMAAGFCDASHLNRVFSKLEDCSPTAYRHSFRHLARERQQHPLQQ